MPRMRITWECDWQPRKVALVQANIIRIFHQFGGVANIGAMHIETVGEDAPPPEARPLLKLVCRQYALKDQSVCDTKWESEFMTPCPKCGGRKFVKKRLDEDPAPKAADAVAPPSAAVLASVPPPGALDA